MALQYCERRRPSGLHFEPSQLTNLDFNADPDPGFEFDTDLDPPLPSDADPDLDVAS